MPPIEEHFPTGRRWRRGDRAPLCGSSPREPGEIGTFAVDLEPGQRYAFICFARDVDDDEPHAFQGMSSEFRPAADPNAPPTTAAPSDAAPPETPPPELQPG